MPKGYPLRSQEEREELRQRRNDYSREYGKKWRVDNKDYMKSYLKDYRRMDTQSNSSK